MNDDERISGVDFDWHNPHTQSKLSRAVLSKNVAEISLLLKQGMSPDVPDNRGYTALHEASKSDEMLDIVRLLVDNGAFVEHKTVDGETPLYKACQYSCEKLVDYYLTAAGCLVNNPTIDGITPLHVASGKKNVNIVKMLVKAGGNIFAKDNEMLTPLYYAIQFGNIAAVKVLLEAGCDAKSVDYFNRTPLQFACMAGNLDIFETLVDHLGRTEVLLNQQTSDGWSLLMEAVQFKNYDIAKKLLDYGADTSLVDSRGMLALHIAAHCDRFDCFDLILRHTPIATIERFATLKDDLKHTRSLPCLLIDKNMLKGLELLFNFGVSDNVLSCPARMGDTLVSPVSFLLVYNNSMPFEDKVKYLELLLSKDFVKDPVYSIERSVVQLRSVEAAVRAHRSDHNSCKCDIFLSTLLNEGVDPDVPIDESHLPGPFVKASRLAYAKGIRLLMAFSNTVDPEQMLCQFVDDVVSPDYQWNRNESELMTFLVWASTDFDDSLRLVNRLTPSLSPELSLKISPLFEIVKTQSRRVQTLKNLTRRFIKKRIRFELTNQKDFRKRVASLPLPRILVDFLLHQELLSYSL